MKTIETVNSSEKNITRKLFDSVRICRLYMESAEPFLPLGMRKGGSV